MSYQDEYEKRHRVLTINDYGSEVTVRVSDGVTWHGLVEMAVNAIRGLGYSGVPAGDAVVEALEMVMDHEAAMDDYIERVSLWKPNAQRKVKDDYATILTWLRKSNVPRQTPENIAIMEGQDEVPRNQG